MAELSRPSWLELPWVIVGAGRAGRTMGLVAQRLGVAALTTWSRSAEGAASTLELLPSADARFGPLPEALKAQLEQPAIWWLTVVDDAIASVAEALRGKLAPGSVALHMAGSLSSELLRGLGPDVAVASLHPLYAIASPQAAVEQLKAAFWTVEGDDFAVALATSLMATQGVTPVKIRASAKPLYHAAAVLSANLLVSLLDIADLLAQDAGIEDEAQRKRMLLPLAQSALDNLRVMPAHEALTGPVARGDLSTILRHEQALAAQRPELLEVYQRLTAHAQQLILRKK